MADNIPTDDELREFDELVRMEAAERGESYASPFDEAAAAAAPDDDAPAAPVDFGAIPEPKPKRKRDRKSTGRRPGRPKKDGAKPGARAAAGAPGAPGAAAAGAVQGPPPPAAGAPASTATVVVDAIPPAQLEPLIKRLDAALAARVGTEPLTEKDVQDGAAILSPLLHHYMPAVVTSDKPWVPLAIWATAVYAPRLLDRATVDPRAQLASPAEAPASSPVDFPQPVATQGVRGDAPTVAPAHAADATPPVFTNPLANLPDAPHHGHFG